MTMFSLLQIGTMSIAQLTLIFLLTGCIVKIGNMYLFFVHKKKKIILFIKLEGLDKSLFLCYNISMKDKKESFYFILSFAMKENTRRIKP